VEDLIPVWQIGIIALLAGALIGVLVYRLLSPSVKQADKIKTELDAARKELGSYKASVNKHFDKTSELVNDLTQNYVKVYQHLAEGAQTLGDSKTFNNLLEQHQGKISIAVDEEKNAPDETADDLIVDAVVTPAASAETVDEHAEPFTEVGTGETDPASPDEDASISDKSDASGDAEAPAETTEPELDADAAEKAVENSDVEAAADAGEASPEDEEKTKPGTPAN
jgi:uncharacterized membrane-anchored protein YhcB (DUF1043 family)